MATSTIMANRPKILKTIDATGYDALKIMSRTQVASNVYLNPLYQSGEIRMALWTEPIIYVTVGTVFGKTVEFENVVFNVPEEFQGMKDTALVLPSKSFQFEERKGQLFITVRNGMKIHKVENFPSTDGWYLQDANTGIPQGAQSNSDNEAARYLWRRNAKYVGPELLGFDIAGRVIYAIGGLHFRCRVALLEREAYSKSATKQDSIHAKLAVQMKMLLRELSEVERTNAELTKQLSSLREIARIAGQMQEDLDNLKPNLR